MAKPTQPLKPGVNGMRPTMGNFGKDREQVLEQVQERTQKFGCSTGQPPRPHRSCVPALPCHRGCGAMTASVCSHSQRVRLLPKPAADSVAPWQRFGNCCGGQRPSLLRRASRGGGRNARATSRVQRFWMFSPGNPLSQITGCHQLCRNYRASSGTLTFH